MAKLIALMISIVIGCANAYADRDTDVARARQLVDTVWTTVREITGIHGTDKVSMLALHKAQKRDTYNKEGRMCSEMVFPSPIKGKRLAYSMLMYVHSPENPSGIFWDVTAFWFDDKGTKAEGVVRFLYEQSYEGNLPKGEPVFRVEYREPYARADDPNRIKNLLATNGEWGFPGEDKTYAALVRDNNAPMWLNALYVLSHIHPKRFAEWCNLKELQKEEGG